MVTMKRLLAVCLGLLLLGACSSEPVKTEPAKPKVKDPEYDTGRVALQRLYAHARAWQVDAQPYRLESQFTQDWKGKDGKSGQWRGGFASAASKGMKPFVWVGSNAPDAGERGINPLPEDNYNPGNASNHVFDMAFVKVDSEQALATALKHGGDKLLAADANQPVLYVLEWYAPRNAVVWHVVFGESRDGAKLTVMVDASTGDFMRVEK
jgi:hypothetical protein